MKKQTIIIMEGHDMSGKSTISKALSVELGLPVLKIEHISKYIDYMNDLYYGGEVHCQTAQQTNLSVIYDRLYPSEYAYSRITGRVTSHEQLLSLDERYAKMGAVIVICYKRPEAYQKDDGDETDVTFYTNLTEWYKEFSKITKCKCIMLDTTDENVTEQLAAIKELL